MHQSGLDPKTLVPSHFRFPTLQVRRDESVVENLHGVSVADPYRWLEDPDSQETQQCMPYILCLLRSALCLLLSSFLSSTSVFADVTAQNELTNNVLSQCETRQQFNDLLTELFDYPRYSCPRRHGKRYMTPTPHMGQQLNFLVHMAQTCAY